MFIWEVENWKKPELKAALKRELEGKTSYQKRLSIAISSLVGKLGGQTNRNRAIKLDAALQSEFGISLEEAINALNKY